LPEKIKRARELWEAAVEAQSVLDMKASDAEDADNVGMEPCCVCFDIYHKRAPSQPAFRCLLCLQYQHLECGASLENKAPVYYKNAAMVLKHLGKGVHLDGHVVLEGWRKARDLCILCSSFQASDEPTR